MRLPPLLLLALLGSCTAVPAPRPRPAQPQPVPTHAPPPPAALPPDWRDWPYTPGDWVYRQDTRGSIALFGSPGADAAFTIRCDLAANAIYLSRAGSTPAPITIRTSSATRTLTTQPTGGAPAFVAAVVQPRDGLLEAMGFSRGRFVVEQAGYPALVLPAWAEIERVTEDCRR